LITEDIEVKHIVIITIYNANSNRKYLQKQLKCQAWNGFRDQVVWLQNGGKHKCFFKRR